jgi:hypothetical protein
MLAKWKLEMLGILASLSLVSVGFSTWNISATIPITNTVQGNLQADYVIKTDEYVYFDKDGNKETDDGIVLPKYNAGGFIVPDPKLDGGYISSNSATITLYLTVDYSKCKGADSALMKNGDTLLQIDCDIAFTNVELFNDNTTISLHTYNSKNGISSSAALISILDPDEKNKIVCYNLRLFNYSLGSLTQDDLITINLTLTSKDKSKINGLLVNNWFLFNTQVCGSK